MKSVIIENLEFRLSVLNEELARLNNQCRSNMLFGKAFDNKLLFRISQIKHEIYIIKNEIHSQKTSGVRKDDPKRICK
jgi:uncharacterized small protein (DUF1192 family)